MMQDIQEVPQGTETAYDSVWTATDAPEALPAGIESIMLPFDKVFVVLTVVMIIWFGILFFLVRTDRKLSRLERDVSRGISQSAP